MSFAQLFYLSMTFTWWGLHKNDPSMSLLEGKRECLEFGHSRFHLCMRMVLFSSSLHGEEVVAFTWFCMELWVWSPVGGASLLAVALHFHFPLQSISPGHFPFTLCHESHHSFCYAWKPPSFTLCYESHLALGYAWKPFPFYFVPWTAMLSLSRLGVVEAKLKSYKCV